MKCTIIILYFSVAQNEWQTIYICICGKTVAKINNEFQFSLQNHAFSYDNVHSSIWYGIAVCAVCSGHVSERAKQHEKMREIQEMW